LRRRCSASSRASRSAVRLPGIIFISLRRVPKLRFWQVELGEPLRLEPENAKMKARSRLLGHARGSFTPAPGYRSRAGFPAVWSVPWARHRVSITNRALGADIFRISRAKAQRAYVLTGLVFCFLLALSFPLCSLVGKPTWKSRRAKRCPPLPR
jgi:hypothetical protein